MKKLFYLICLVPFLALAQSTDQNYVKSVTYKDSTITTNLAKANVAVTYVDGLGRPVQHVAGKMSGTGNDIITPIEYDAFSRQLRDYLPYPSTSTTLSYDASGTANAMQYYQTAGTTVTDPTLFPYSEKFMEASPLGRVLKQSAPGNTWAGNANDNNDHTVKMAYLTNITTVTTEAVKMLKATASQTTTANSIYDIVTYNDGGSYPAGTLYKSVVQDENRTGDVYTGTSAVSKNNIVEEFKDSDGKVVLKRTYNAGAPHDTYYVYDQFGNLSFVLPPLANGATTYLADLCYQYKYDTRNRLVEKKLPGKQWEFIVYDALDRVIATGPAISPFGGVTTSNVGWLYSYYDALGRPAYSGWYPATVNTTTRNTLQAANTGIPYKATRGTGTIGDIATGYSAPAVITGFKLLTVNYYDNYTWPGAGTPATVEGQAVLATAKGLPTGSWTRALDTATGISGETTYIFYDGKGRAVRTKTTNYLGGYIQTDSNLGFDGRVNYTITHHKRLNGDPTELLLREDFTYNAQDRLLAHTHKINSLAVQNLAGNLYNDLGQLITKNVGTATPSTDPIQTINYKYNIRGWLTDINDISNIGSDRFAFKINYNTVSNSVNGNVTPLYNGNISETQWLSSADNIIRKYGYKYDNLNRITSAYYQKPGQAIINSGSYNETAAYDKNGNITGINRWGGPDDPSTVVPIDLLSYTYATGSNRLMKVVDNSNSTQGFKDSAANTVNDYGYDDNGNLNLDNNKGITDITYNHLNLPVQISFGATNKITYLYNAAGVKLKKTVVELQGSTTVTMVVDYLGGFQYKAGVLQFFPTAEGRVDNTVVSGVNNYNYVYQYKDHLGNVRMNYTWSPPTFSVKGSTPGVVAIMDESHYYPFGLQHQFYNTTYLQWQSVEDELVLYPPISTGGKLAYNYKFGGKELQEELGFQSYDFGARNYDPALGRWMNIDPLAEASRRFSPYVYALNNPVYFIDPDGMKADGLTTEQSGMEEGYPVSDEDQLGRSRHDENGGYLMPGERSGGDDDSGGKGKGKSHFVDYLRGVGKKVLDKKKGFWTRLWAGLEPRTWEDPDTGAVLTVNADGIATGIQPKGGAGALGFIEGGAEIKLFSLVKSDSKLFKLAQETFSGNKALSKEANSLIEQLSKGNMNPGIGTKSIMRDIFEARSSGGARVYFRKIGQQIEILAYSNKANQQAVIDRILKLF